MSYATIYDCQGHALTDGLQSAKVCDEAIIIARRVAKDRGESVYVEDRGARESYAVNPDGSISNNMPIGWFISWDEESEQ